jgi:hypothetical protein
MGATTTAKHFRLQKNILRCRSPGGFVVCSLATDLGMEHDHRREKTHVLR